MPLALSYTSYMKYMTLLCLTSGLRGLMTSASLQKSAPAQKLRIYHRLQTVAHLAKKRADIDFLETAKITAGQAAVLAIIKANPGISQGDLSHQLDVNQSAVTTMIDRLLKLALIQRQTNPNDGRARCLTLTPSGETAVQLSFEAMKAVNTLIDGALNKEEIVQLDNLLARLASRMRI
jgi:DNA-binding MarR family transcriptional regulator